MNETFRLTNDPAQARFDRFEVLRAFLKKERWTRPEVRRIDEIVYSPRGCNMDVDGRLDDLRDAIDDYQRIEGILFQDRASRKAQWATRLEVALDARIGEIRKIMPVRKTWAARVKAEAKFIDADPRVVRLRRILRELRSSK